jgi:hypothetical protein
MPSRHTPRPLNSTGLVKALPLPFLARSSRPPASPSAETMPLLPEERGWHIVRARWLEPLFSVSYRRRGHHMIPVIPQRQDAI